VRPGQERDGLHRAEARHLHLGRPEPGGVQVMTATAVESTTGSGATPGPARPVPRRRHPAVGTGLGLGTAVLYLSLIVLIPLAALVWRWAEGGWGPFWAAVRPPDAWAALQLTVGASLVVAIVNVVMGTVIAWVLVRDSFPGKGVVDALIDLPFALPTI